MSEVKGQTSEIDQQALEEILKETATASQRAQVMGIDAWLKKKQPKPNKNFIKNTLLSSVQSSRRVDRRMEEAKMEFKERNHQNKRHKRDESGESNKRSKRHESRSKNEEPQSKKMRSRFDR